MKHYISLGAGVQSSTMALMAAAGEITPMPEAAIFADTQDEPASVYRWLDWLEKQLPFPVHRVTKGKISEREMQIRTSKRSGKNYRKSSIPIFVLNPTDGSIGPLSRKCTYDFKIEPLTAEVRRLANIQRGQKEHAVIQWIGISLDEMQRMKPSRHPWCTHRWPLIEQRITRSRCLEWMQAKGYPTPPRSACVFCPYHSNAEWRRLKTDEPEEFAKAVKFEKDLQDALKGCEVSKGQQFLHRSMKPLDEVDFRSDVERGQLTLWDDECEGMCGV